MGQCLKEGVTLCLLYFILFCIVIVWFDSFHCIVHCRCGENRMNGFGVWWLKRNQNHKLNNFKINLKCLWFNFTRTTNDFKINFDHKTKKVLLGPQNAKPELKSEPQRETKTETQSCAQFSCHGVARGRCGARLTDATGPCDLRRSIAMGTSSWSYRTHDAI